MSAPPAGLVETARPHLPEGGCLFRTSGTTGEPKWAALEKRAFMHSARVVNAHYGLTKEDRWLRALPDCHVGGFSIYARCWLSASNLSILRGKWDSKNFVAQLKDNAVTVTSIVPTQLHDLVSERLRSPACLRVLMVGGGRIDPHLMRSALDLGWPVCATYGMTETASQVASQALDHDRRNDPETLEVLPHWNVSVDDQATLTVRGPSLAKGYVLVTTAGFSWQSIDAEQGLPTRDRVQLSQHGTRTFLRFLGREQSCLKILGELVHLDSLEQRIRHLCPAGFPPIALLALPDARREHVLVLAVESAVPPHGLERVLSVHHQTSHPCERISHQLCLAEFPRTTIGKINLAKLKAQVAARRGVAPPASR